MQTESSFHFHIVMSGDDVVVVLAGEIDLPAAAPLRDVIVAALGGRPSRLTLDLDEVTFIDATGARALVQTQRAAVAAGTAVTVRGAGGLQREVLQLAGMRGLDGGSADDDGPRRSAGWRSAPSYTPDVNDPSAAGGVRRS